MPETPIHGNIHIERIFVKKLEFDSPDTPEVFELRWQPKTTLDINAGQEKLEEGRFEVVLRISMTATIGKKRAFTLTLEQAGYFRVQGLEGDALHQVLMVVCPNILFPYAREAVDNVVTKASFPPVVLAPVSFEAVFRQAMAQRKQAALGSTSEVVN